MFVVRQKEHDKFKRKGADLIAQQEITLEEALTGGKFTIEHLANKRVTLSLEPNCIVKPNDILLIDGLGLPILSSGKKMGKLYLIISVKFPEHIEKSKLELLLKVNYNGLT